MSSFHERRQRLADTQGPLMLLEVSAPSMPEVLRIVNDNVNWTSNGSEFIAAPFGFQLPDDVSGQAPRAQLVIDNIGRALTEDLEALAPGEMVTARLLVTDRANPDAIEAESDLPMTQAVFVARGGTLPRGKPKPAVRELKNGDVVSTDDFVVKVHSVIHAQPILECFGALAEAA